MIIDDSFFKRFGWKQKGACPTAQPPWFRSDFQKFGIKRFYIVENHNKGFIRAWHGHRKEEKYAMIIKGTALIAAINMDNNQEWDRLVLDERKPQIIKIPKNYYNGFKLLTKDAKLMFFSTSTIEEAKYDDYRKSLTKIMPEIFNIEER